MPLGAHSLLCLRNLPTRNLSQPAAVGSRVKYLVDTPELIWGCLDARQHLDAARRYLRAELVHELLLRGFPPATLHKFPLLRHHWPTVTKFKCVAASTLHCGACHRARKAADGGLAAAFVTCVAEKGRGALRVRRGFGGESAPVARLRLGLGVANGCGGAPGHSYNLGHGWHGFGAIAACHGATPNTPYPLPPTPPPAALPLPLRHPCRKQVVDVVQQALASERQLSADLAADLLAALASLQGLDSAALLQVGQRQRVPTRGSITSFHFMQMAFTISCKGM